MSADRCQQLIRWGGTLRNRVSRRLDHWKLRGKVLCTSLAAANDRTPRNALVKQAGTSACGENSSCPPQISSRRRSWTRNLIGPRHDHSLCIRCSNNNAFQGPVNSHHVSAAIATVHMIINHPLKVPRRSMSLKHLQHARHETRRLCDTWMTFERYHAR